MTKRIKVLPKFLATIRAILIKIFTSFFMVIGIILALLLNYFFFTIWAGQSPFRW